MTEVEFGKYQAQWYINAAYFYLVNKSWCKSHPEEFWDKFFGGSDDDVDYYKPDYDMDYYEDEDDEEDNRDWDEEDRALFKEYDYSFDEACPAFIKYVWKNLKHNPVLIEGAKFFLDSEAY